MNRDEGLQALKDSIEAIEDVITSKNGTFIIQQAVSLSLMVQLQLLQAHRKILLN